MEGKKASRVTVVEKPLIISKDNSKLIKLINENKHIQNANAEIHDKKPPPPLQ